MAATARNRRAGTPIMVERIRQPGKLNIAVCALSETCGWKAIHCPAFCSRYGRYLEFGNAGIDQGQITTTPNASHSRTTQLPV